ncbi:MAG: AAA family ATPase [Pseudonocardiaceae bacterium]
MTDLDLSALIRPETPDQAAAEQRADIVGRYSPIHWPDLWADTSDDGPDWLVPDLLERGRSHALVGAAKSGKSLLTLDMVCGLVTGRGLLGRPSPHDGPVTVVYVDLENAKADIRERLDALGVGPGDLGRLAYYSFPSLPALDSAHGGEHLVALAEHHDAELVVIDTVARVVVGPENDADTFRALYRHALAPIKAQARAVLRLDHLGKDSTAGARGSSAKADDVDTIWHLIHHGEGRLTLRLDRQRSGHHPEMVDLTRRTDGQLRHVRCEVHTDPRVTALVADLERLGVPLDAGRRTARRLLTDAGIKAGNDLIVKALGTRRTGHEVVPDHPETAELFKIINDGPGDPEPQADNPSSARSRTGPGPRGPGEVVPTADRSAPTPGPVRGPGWDRPPGPDPATTTALHLLTTELGAQPVESACPDCEPGQMPGSLLTGADGLQRCRRHHFAHGR